MGEFSPFDCLEDESAVRFDFRSITTLDERAAVELFDVSGAAWWVKVRTEKFSEHLDPQIMYVAPATEHHVVWLKHTGIVETEQEDWVPYTKYHVVCDCAAEEELSPHPVASLYCDVVNDVLLQRASELSRENRLTETLGVLTEFNDEVLDFRLTYLGEELAIRALERLLDADIRHPEAWAANRINGLHEVENLAAFVGRSSDETRSLLEIMQQAELIQLDGDKVLVPANQIIE